LPLILINMSGIACLLRGVVAVNCVERLGDQLYLTLQLNIYE